MGCYRRVVDVFRSLLNPKTFQLKCARILHERLLLPVLVCGGEMVVRMEKERSRTRAVQMDNLSCLLGTKNR